MHGGDVQGDRRQGERDAGRTATTHRRRGIAWEALMVNSCYLIYQAERGKTAAEVRASEARLGGFAAAPDAG